MKAGRSRRVQFGTMMAAVACLPFLGCAGGSAAGAPASGPGVAAGETGGDPAVRTDGRAPPPGGDESATAATGSTAWVDPEADLRPSAAPAPGPAGRGSLTLRAPDLPLPAGFPVRIEATVGADGGDWPAPVHWTSSDRSVIRVDAAGVVTGTGPGSAWVTATSGSDSAEIELGVVPDRARILVVSPPEALALPGEVLHFTASVRSVNGAELEDGRVHWSSTPIDGEQSARVDPDGAFVAPASGTWLVTAARGALSSSAVVQVGARGRTTTLRPIASAPLPGTGGAAAGIRVFEGMDGRDWAWVWTDRPARIHVWDVTDPENPAFERSVVPGSERVHDLEIGGGNSWAVVALSHPAGDDAGLLVLDLSTPANPATIARVTDGLGGGTSAVAVDRDVVWAAAIEDGSLIGFDFSDPRVPRRSGSWRSESVGAGGSPGGSHIADIDVRDGIALLARWHDGLAVLDVGAGIRDGTVQRPALVSEYTYRVRLDGKEWGNTLEVRRWRDWVLLADGIDGCDSCIDGPRGGVHIIDVADIERPRESAWFRVPEAGARDLQIDPRTERLTAAFGTGGLRLVDLSGELRGDLYVQGRETYAAPTGAWMNETPSRSLARGARILKQAVFVADMYAGLRVFRVEPEEE